MLLSAARSRGDHTLDSNTIGLSHRFATLCWHLIGVRTVPWIEPNRPGYKP